MLYNIDANGQAVNILGDSANGKQITAYSKKEKKRLFSSHDDSAKVAAIAQKIKELTQKTDDP